MRLLVPVCGVLLGVLAVPCTCPAQQLIGYVSRHDASVTGWTDEVDGQAVLSGSSSITTRDQAVPVKLSRGGAVRVCQASELKLTASRDVTSAPPMLFSLDRGGIEIETNGTPSDSVMTPDLRVAIRTSGPLDLRVHVARNGDTCVDNRGATAPTLAVSDAFGESMYEVPAGQHVVFEHGSVRDVLAHETAPCGCPVTGDSVAQALLAPGTAKKAPADEPSNPTAEQHPFPAVPATVETAAPPVAPSGPPQISDALTYTAGLKDPDELNGGSSTPVNVTATRNSPEQTSSVHAKGSLAAAPMPAAPAAPVVVPRRQEQPPANDLAHIIGRAFKKLFGR
ncbi:MAG TPA: hypothetical protein VJU82_19135 [Acidobacteriaceae bacterium]|nr:hypothetical protein [Acidobacteriaceae bacterium]